MKKLALLLIAIVLIALSSNVYAQDYSTGENPFPGATHTYSVTNTEGTFSWKVFVINADNSLTEVSSYSGDEVAGFSASTNSVDITWSENADVDNQYLVVVEQTVNGCKNSKAMPITITASTFDLLATAGSDACYAESVVVGWDGSKVTYDHGQATVTYEVTASGVKSSEDWKFKPNISSTELGSELTVVSLTVTDGTNTLSADGNGIYTLTGAETAYVTVIVENDASYDNSSALDAQDITVTMSLSDISSGSGGVENNVDSNTADVAVSRPNTELITTDN